MNLMIFTRSFTFMSIITIHGLVRRPPVIPDDTLKFSKNKVMFINDSVLKYSVVMKLHVTSSTDNAYTVQREILISTRV